MIGAGRRAATAYVSVQHGGKALFSLTDEVVDLNGSQGDIGLFVPDASYPFGVIPCPRWAAGIFS